MDYSVIVAQVLALLQQEPASNVVGGITERRAKESPAEHIATMLDVCAILH